MTWGKKGGKRGGWGSGGDSEEKPLRFSGILGGILELVPGGVLRAGKRAYTSTTSGWWLGVDTDSVPKFNFGGVTNFIRWTGTALEIAGSLAGDLVGDLTVVGRLLIVGATAGIFGNDGTSDRWKLENNGFTIIQPEADANYMRIVLANGVRIGTFGGVYEPTTDEVAGRAEANAATVGSDVYFTVGAQGFDAATEYISAGMSCVVDYDTVPHELFNIGSTDADGVAEFRFYHFGSDVAVHPVPGFGLLLRLMAEDGSAGSMDMGAIKAAWDVVTHGSQAASVEIQAADSTGLRTGVKVSADGTQVLLGLLGAAEVARQAHIADPAGGGTVDTEARTAIGSILDVLELFGLVAT